jgi:hypothetical protein
MLTFAEKARIIVGHLIWTSFLTMPANTPSALVHVARSAVVSGLESAQLNLRHKRFMYDRFAHGQKPDLATIAARQP